MDRTHISAALDEELTHPRTPDTRAADMAFAAASALAFVAANAAAPAVGGVVAAVGIVEARRHLQGLPARDSSHVHDAVEAELAYRVVPGATASWSSWLPWAELCDGADLDVPKDLDHPSASGFQPTRLASYVGQKADWVHPLADGSRLHAHEYADGSVTLHRDRVDPARGPATAAVHWFSETPEGNTLGAALAVFGIGALIWTVKS